MEIPRFNNFLFQWMILLVWMLVNFERAYADKYK